MAMQMSAAGDEKVVLQTFTMTKEIPRAEKCTNLPVMIRVTAAPYQEHWRPSLDLVVMINYDSRRSMLNTTPDHVKSALRSMIDQLGPGDRLSIVDNSFRAQRRNRMSMQIEMFGDGPSIAKQWVENMDDGSKFGANAVEEASEILKKHGTNKSHNRVGCIILIAYGCCKLQATTSNIEFPVHLFCLSDLADMELGNINEKTSITCYDMTTIPKINDMITHLISELRSVITRGIQIHMKAHDGVIISSIESGGHGSRINAEEGTGIIEIDYLCAGEEKNFIVKLDIPENVKELMTVDANCNDNSKIRLNQIGVSVERPAMRSEKEMCPDVAAEITRIKLVNCVCKLDHRRSAKAAWKKIRKSVDSRNVPESVLLAFDEDMALIETNNIYRNLWCEHHVWQRASIKALLSSRDPGACLYVYTHGVNDKHH